MIKEKGETTTTTTTTICPIIIIIIILFVQHQKQTSQSGSQETKNQTTEQMSNVRDGAIDIKGIDKPLKQEAKQG